MTALGREYVPVSEDPKPTLSQRNTIAGLRRMYDWTEVTYLANGTAEVAVLDYRGIIERIITVFFDGGTATTGSQS